MNSLITLGQCRLLIPTSHTLIIYLFEIHFNVWRCTNFSTKVQFSVQFSQNKKFRHLYYLPTGIFIYDSLLYHSLLCCIFNKITVHDKNFFTFIKYTHYIREIQKIFVISGNYNSNYTKYNSKKVKISNISSRLLHKIHRERTRFYSFASSCPRFYICNNFSIHCAINVHSFTRFFFFLHLKNIDRVLTREYWIEMKIKRAGRD